MNFAWRISSFFLAAMVATAQAAAPNKARDLKYEDNAPATPSAAIPTRRYALIVGISNYKNLPAKSQLEFPERDADAVYSVLILATKVCNFHAENVHRP